MSVLKSAKKSIKKFLFLLVLISCVVSPLFASPFSEVSGKTKEKYSSLVYNETRGKLSGTWKISSKDVSDKVVELALQKSGFSSAFSKGEMVKNTAKQLFMYSLEDKCGLSYSDLTSILEIFDIFTVTINKDTFTVKTSGLVQKYNDVKSLIIQKVKDDDLIYTINDFYYNTLQYYEWIFSELDKGISWPYIIDSTGVISLLYDDEEYPLFIVNDSFDKIYLYVDDLYDEDVEDFFLAVVLQKQK